MRDGRGEPPQNPDKAPLADSPPAVTPACSPATSQPGLDDRGTNANFTQQPKDCLRDF